MLGHYSVFEAMGFGAIVVIALIVDLYAHRADKAISMRDAALWSVFWVALSLGFAFYVGKSHGVDDAYLFLAGYTLEKALSVDNLFVFIAIFSAFSKTSNRHIPIPFWPNGKSGESTSRL